MKKTLFVICSLFIGIYSLSAQSNVQFMPQNQQYTQEYFKKEFDDQANYYMQRAIYNDSIGNLRFAMEDLAQAAALGNMQARNIIDNIEIQRSINDEKYKQMESQQRQQQSRQGFYEGTVPGLAERFTSLGGGRVGSGTFSQQVASAGRGL
jgi:hypothetical protein